MHGKDYTIKELIEMGPKSYTESLEPVSERPGDYWQNPKIDPEIYPLIVELNQSGYKTIGSCAGHPGAITSRGEDSTGYIVFPPDLSEGEIDDIKYIFRRHGISNPKVVYPGYKNFPDGKKFYSNRIAFEFPAEGKY